MRSFLQGRIDLVQQLRTSSIGATHQDLVLILTAVISACAAWRWPGEGFDRKRFVETLVQFSPPPLHADYVSIGALLEFGLIAESQTPWRGFADRTRIFTGQEIDSSLPEMSSRYPNLTTRDLKRASYANLIYRWLRCGYAHTYWPSGNTTHVPPSHQPAQISYIGRSYPNGKLIRVASFHLDYLLELTQQQVSTLPDNQIPEPNEWWIEQA
jgi:hypothetical protein